MYKEIGKIKSIDLGKHDYFYGIRIVLAGEAWGTCTSLDNINDLKKYLDDAKVNTMYELNNKPIEATFDSPIGKLISWRILTEVL